MVLELIDQLARSTRGGAMEHSLWAAAADSEQQDFIRQRFGLHAEKVWEAAKRPLPSVGQRLRAAGPRLVARRLRLGFVSLLVRLLGGAEAQRAFREGIFRRSRETHLHMYDRFSLARLLEKIGFCNPRVLRAEESSIPDFARYELDVVDGRVRKPDSLFMEANKRSVASGAGR